jgi:hypothetical protein
MIIEDLTISLRLQNQTLTVTLTPLRQNSAVSDSALLLTVRSQKLAVFLTPLNECRQRWINIKNFYWLSFSQKKESNQSQERMNYSIQGLQAEA